MSLQTLSELIPGWPETAPQTGAELIFCDNDELNELGLDEATMELIVGVRRHMRTATLARGGSSTLASISQVEKALISGDLELRSNRWMTMVLDRQRRRVFVQHDSGNSRTVRRISKWVPEASELPELPEGGTYLVLRGGGPDILDIDDVRHRLRALQQAVPVADIVFRRIRKGEAPTVWSMREGCGSAANERVEFPNPDHLKEVALWS